MSYAPRQLPPHLAAHLDAALRQAEADPARRSEILGQTALGLDAAAQRPEHARQAPRLRALAEQIAEAALAGQEVPDPASLDDFDEQLHEVEAAHGQFKEDIDVIARADDLHDQKTAQHGARVSIAPLSWGAGATLGRSGKFKYAPTQEDIANTIAQSSTLAYWVGEPHEATAITVDVALVAPPAGAENGNIVGLIGTPDTSARPYVTVQYGSDGAVTSVKLDAGFGTRLTVVGSYVAVIVGMGAPAKDALSGTLSFCASIGAFAAPSTAPVFYTEYLDDVPSNTDSPLIQRPQHATHILPILTSSAVGGFALLKFFGMGAGGSAGKVLYAFNYNLAQLQLPIPLPGQVQYIQLQNNTPQVQNFAIPFQLSL